MQFSMARMFTLHPRKGGGVWPQSRLSAKLFLQSSELGIPQPLTRGDIRKWIFIAGVNNIGNKLFSGVNDTGEKILLTGK